MRAFRTRELAEQFREGAEKYLLDNGLFTRVERETKWGVKVYWVRNEDWNWFMEGVWEKCELLSKENPFDPVREYESGYGFQGYSIDEILLEE